jgi:hypothetical protein
VGEEAFILMDSKLEASSEEEGWYTDQESDGLENNQVNDRKCVKDESTLRYELL